MRKKNLILLAFVSAAALALYAWRDRSTVPPHEQTTQAEPSAHSAPAAPEPAAEAPSTRAVASPATGASGRQSERTFAEMHATAANNLEFIRQIYAAAQGGDTEAQFQLFSALEYCERNYRFYFVRGSSRKTLDEALAWATRSPGTSAEEAREVHRRCRELMDNHANDFGRSDSWLTRAAGSGHPEAQLVRAERLLMMSGHVSDEDARVTDPRDDQDRRAEAKELLRKGLERRDPSAVWKIGDLQDPLVGNSQNADKGQWVWRLAACKLGYDCSQTADWYRFMCRFDYNCQPYESGVDLILRASAATYPDVDLLSDELVDKINKGDLSDLGWR